MASKPIKIKPLQLSEAQYIYAQYNNTHSHFSFTLTFFIFIYFLLLLLYNFVVILINNKYKHNLEIECPDPVSPKSGYIEVSNFKGKLSHSNTQFSYLNDSNRNSLTDRIKYFQLIKQEEFSNILCIL